VDRRVLLVAIFLELFPTGVARAGDHSPESASADDKRQAQELYDGAMKRFDQDDYDAALRGFQSSYEHVKSPNSHFMIARSLARLGRNVEAYKELSAVIDECSSAGSRYADTEHAAYAKREEVTPRIGLLTVTLGNAPKGTKVFVGDEELPPSEIGKPIAVLPGESAVVAAPPKGKRHTQKVTVRTGTSATLAIDIPEEEKPKAPVKEEPFDETDHTDYKVELAFHLAGETVTPNDKDSRGAGPGARLYVNILPRGLINGLNDSFAVGAGADWILSSSRRHVLVPVTAQWNFWLMNRLALIIEPGADLVLGAGTHLQPTIYAGLRYVVVGPIALVGKMGIPDATIGAAAMF
jgi:hypothetical protein